MKQRIPFNRCIGMRMTIAAPALTAFGLGLIALAVPSSSWAGTVIVDMTDPANDDRGPGHYSYPVRNDYRRGDLDLRRFTVIDEGEFIRFEVTLGRVLRPLLEPRRSRAFIVPLSNRLTVQNIDIYLQRPEETDRVHRGLPGRQLAFDEGQGWTRAVVFTPQPGYARHLLKPWAHASKVIVPGDLQSIGRKVWARVRVSALGGRPGPGWGFAVAVSGALWENRFQFYRQAESPDVVNVLTVPVHVTPDWRRFGGGDLSGANPNVLDILASGSRAQKAILTSYEAKTGAWARLPMLRISGP